MTGTDTFEHESIQDRQSIRQYFNTLIEGIEKGSLTLNSENDNILLTPTERVRFSIKTRKKPGKSKLTIKLVWNESTAENPKEKCSAIQILSCHCHALGAPECI